MKKEYLTPDLQRLSLSPEDVITASPGDPPALPPEDVETDGKWDLPSIAF